MMDFFSHLIAMTEEYEAHGKTWVLIDLIRVADDKSGGFYTAVEKGAVTPTPVQMIFKKSEQSNVGQPGDWK